MEEVVEMDALVEENDQNPNATSVQAHQFDIRYTQRELLRRSANLFRIFPLPDLAFAVGDVAGASTLQIGQGALRSWRASRIDYSQTRPSTMTIVTPAKRGFPKKMDFLIRAGVIAKVRSGSPASKAGLRAGLRILAVDGQSYATLGKKGLIRQFLNGRTTIFTVTSASNPVDDTSWESSIAKRSQQTQAYVNAAIRSFSRARSQKALVKWFGKEALRSRDFRREVLRILNSLNDVLQNSQFARGGDACTPRTFAMVYPDGRRSRDSHGRYLIMICEKYFQVEKTMQIETLAHEASHHSGAFTDDVCIDDLRGDRIMKVPRRKLPPGVVVGGFTDVFDRRSGRYVEAVAHVVAQDWVWLQLEPKGQDCNKRAYNRRTCYDLARKSPVKAIRNADNYCFFVIDVVGAR
jgi:hypothetical protein